MVIITMNKTKRFRHIHIIFVKVDINNLEITNLNDFF